MTEHDFLRALNSLSADLLALWLGFLAAAALLFVAACRRSGR